MNTHLSPQEFVDALDDAGSARAQEHLAACVSCRRDLDAARAAMQEARAVDVPEPSPLFWDHFSARVSDATQNIAADATRDVAAAPAPWWAMVWRPGVLIASALALAMVVMVQVLRPGPAPVNVSTSNGVGVAPAILPMSDDDGTWVLVEGLAAELEWADVHEAAQPAAGTADAMIDELTPAQRDALVRLLQREMGEL